jgi:hypothetical protein
MEKGGVTSLPEPHPQAYQSLVMSRFVWLMAQSYALAPNIKSKVRGRREEALNSFILGVQCRMLD